MFSWRLEMTWLMIRQNGVFNTWISIIKELEFDRRVIDVFLYYGLVEKCIEPQYLHYSYLLSQILNAQKYGFHLKNFFKVFYTLFSCQTDWFSIIYFPYIFLDLVWEPCTVLENYRKSLIQHCKRSQLRLHFEWTKVH